ncbi:MAG: YdcF family protein, partial [Trebonia sp.]
MFALGLATAAFVVFVAGMAHDSRSFSNAVFLGLALALGALGGAERLAGTHDRAAHLLLLGLVLLAAAGPFLAALYLAGNGVTMVRKEGVRPTTVLPLLAGLAILAVIALEVAADRVGSPRLSLVTMVTVRLAGYVSFLCVSYVLYALIYGKLPVARRADYVVVLGAGLLDGGQVPRLLASRLERGRAVYKKLASRGADPLLIVSGGKGSDEQVSEAAAMARYLTARGFPPGRLILEDRSASTEENLLFSKAIMDQRRPPTPGNAGARCVIVTSGFHAFRAAIIARRLGINGQATGARTAGYYWPGAMLREFAAVLYSYKLVNAGVCALIVVLPLAYDV